VSRVDAIARFVSATGLPRISRGWLPGGPLIVMYHGIGGSDGLHPDAFRAQLELLGSRRRVVSLTAAIDAMGRDDASGLAAVTFDDGYRDFAELAVPILRECEMPATVFVPAGHLGGSNVWDRDFAEPRSIMTAEELRALDSERVEIGVHGYSHCRMCALSDAELARETREAKQVLEDACGRPMRHFAYPYGQGDDFDRRAEHAVAEAGFAAACSTRFGRGSRPSERFRLRRVGIDVGDALEAVARKFEGGYDWVALKEAAGVRLRSLRRREGRRAGTRSSL
jgi:peptidoglycan/xylan/chitin deacetylase (PgdA/CDA1 family)